MKFGIFTMPEHPPWENWTLSYDRDIDEMVQAEKLGFDEYWIGEHHSGAYENVPAPELIIAKGSALTSRIMFGTGVVNLPYHDPFMVAERLAFLDQLTHGRLIYGFGASGLPTDWALFGMEPAEMRPRMEESIEIINRLMQADGPISYSGKYWSAENKTVQVKPFKNRLPEIVLAGLTSLSSYKSAATNGWGALSVYFTPPTFTNNPSFPDLVAQGKCLDESAAAAGLDPIEARRNWRVVREVYIAKDKNTALEEIRKGVKGSYDYLFELGLGALMKLDQEMPDADVTFEWMVDNIPWIIGTPEECSQQIKDLYEEVGGFGSFVINSRDWVPTDLHYRSWEQFARYCMPAVEGLYPGGKSR